MSFNKANSRQIKAGSLDNSHIKAGAAIDESKLNIDWTAKAASILATKLLVDYVQVSAKDVPSAASDILITDKVSATPATVETEKGAIVENGKNGVIVRHSVTGDPVISPSGNEVFGKLTYSGSDYKLSFFYRDEVGAELPFTFTDAAKIDFQFPQRFDLSTISETFAANEKFVDGASDVSARLDLSQITKDIFGDTYDLDQDGDANRTQSLAAELVQETSGVVNTEEKAKDIIDEVVDARNGHDDLSTRFATTDQRIADAEGEIDTLTTEVTGARQSTAKAKTFGNVNARIEEAEQDHIDEVARATAAEETLQENIDTATTAHADYVTANDIRVKAVEDANAVQDTKISSLEGAHHAHFAEDKHILAGDPLINSSRYDLQTGTFVAGDKSLDVYLNGMLQMVGVHYTEVTNASAEGIAISFAPELLLAEDVIQLRWRK